MPQFKFTMMRKSNLLVFFSFKYKTLCTNISTSNLIITKHLHNSSRNFNKDKDLVVYENFESIKNRNKNTYLDMVKIFESKDVHRRGHVEFIYSALKHMESFGVHKDLEVYKALIDVLPKGKLIPRNILQAEFMHYPKQQQCAIDLLEQMEDNAVMPDSEMEAMLLNVFGKRGYPLRKFWRMMYWMPKFKNLSPWLLPEQIPNEIFELAKLAIARIGTVDIQSKMSIYHTADVPEAIEDTWIVSTQSVIQQNLLKQHNPKQPVYIEGTFRIWIKNKSVGYFILRGDPKPIIEEEYNSDDVSHISVPLFGFTPPQKKDVVIIPSVHEQADGVIYAVCVTGTSGRDSLLSWVRLLQKDGNEILANIPVVFTLKAPETAVTNINADEADIKKTS